MKEKILFVCTGNTCRSAMAKGIFDKILKEKKLEDKFTCECAGTMVYMNSPASLNAIEALKEKGIDISSHISKSVNEEMVRESDVTLTMGRNHKEYILTKYPFSEGKVYTLKEYANAIDNINNKKKSDVLYDIDINDPYASSLQVYRDTAKEIESSIEKIIEYIKN